MRLFILLAVITNTALADLERLDLEFRQFIGASTWPILEMVGHKPNSELALNLDVGFLNGFIRWTNRLNSLFDDGSDSQFRSVSWTTQVHFRAASMLSINIGHRSSHVLDLALPTEVYPAANWIGFTWHIWKDKK